MLLKKAVSHAYWLFRKWTDGWKTNQFSFGGLKRAIYRISRLMPTEERTCFFLSDIRKEVGGNFLPLKPVLISRGYRVIEDFREDKDTSESIYRICRRMYYLARARYILLEDYYHDTVYMDVRNGQKLIQLWHAAGAYKRFAWGRAKEKEAGDIHSGYQKYTDAIVSGEEIRKIYAEAFRIPIERVRATGLPRTDVFFRNGEMENIKSKLRKKYPETMGKRVILYAPTYREKLFQTADYNKPFFSPERIHRALGDEYVILLKWHPYAEHYFQAMGMKPYEESQGKGYFIDVSEERDINELLILADILITDYSSVIFEYALMDKPIIYYWYDEDEYVGGRGLYYPAEDYIYGKVAHNEEELICALRLTEKNEELRAKFLQKYMSTCDGYATRRVADLIEEQERVEGT